MKKVISILLVLCLALGLMACGASEGTETTAPKDNRFRVGYARADITPSHSVGLDGYGNTDQRLSNRVLDPLYLTCVAVTDCEDNTLIFVGIDIGEHEESSVNMVRGKIEKATGVPKGNITVSATHTHSAPGFGAISMNILKAAEQTSKEAMEDRAYADMYIGQTQTKGLNFVRSYYMSDGSVLGVSFGSAIGKTYDRHVSDADEQMQLIQFKREGKKDVIMANWQAHNHLTGGSEVYDISADFVGAFRTNIENDLDCLFAYYQGAAGNLNPSSSIKEENAVQPDVRNHLQHGKLLAGHAKEALANMTAVEPGLIKIKTERFPGECLKGDSELVGDAANVIAYYDAGHTIEETRQYAEQFGIHSLYHAKAISGRNARPASEPFPITSIAMGSVAFATIPGELFDSVGQYLKEESPYDMTFILGYCNGAVSYLPSEFGFEYGGYEVDITVYVKGTAEAVAERHVEILKEMKSQ